MIIFILFLWLTITECQDCKDGCRVGPVKMASYICRAPYRPTKDEISPGIIRCANDVLCRLCTGNPYYDIPSICPLVIRNKVDLSGQNYDLIFKKGLEIHGLDKAVVTELLYFDPQTFEARANINVPKLKIEGKYKLNGILCGDKSEHSKGCISIKFEDVILDWYPHVELFQNCNQTFLNINAKKSNLTIINNKPVEFEFKPDCKLSKCFNKNWNDVLDKIRNELQKMLSDAGAYLTNSIINQSPVTEVFDFNS